MNKKRNVQIIGGTLKYFGGTQVEKHCSRDSDRKVVAFFPNRLLFEVNKNEMFIIIIIVFGFF
jgi:hypothetical protein